ncbi:ErfK/YbiS/YcfS/YnhG family protein [Candidatus Propionivibrio aalborgensis]|uniref:ErfK/YbiS/YcfS/YnhG family protein n=1 Tax=Candidatus Propionivibrio aalborgensis TaxID=1860101 RepID=A0A1A8Y0V6_9RHOO|nr:L,D-transpeptidase [Candidatus Propionivibrio aalborgensis]MBK7326920.1 L,D-transpeptidase [Propionivibrio sp.]MBK7563924.1 L,D-transpeptidase [Propionivibrio sp.]MBK9026696.1 L,D-transpeptidase [Propionivibrio sp.]MBP6421474.1 L,D-transpeptidase [Propionivibrio sp.]SBT10779.1 ErfK/YbiS/YcfS/YnhG family protein [Candidatus Propionivibrio aalborgensis]
MHIHISIARQLLTLIDGVGQVIRSYPVSTASRGAGEQYGSFCTPRGKHVIRARIGAGQPVNTVFVARRPTGEIYTEDLGRAFPDRDWMLTRILWLSGCEPGRNRLGCVDSMRRFIYIHGSPDTATMGAPGSHGCIRMRNADILQLFDLVPPYTPVEITED